MKLNYSEPKIYTGGADFVNWSRLKRYHPAKNINANYDGKRLYFDLIDNMTVYV